MAREPVIVREQPGSFHVGDRAASAASWLQITNRIDTRTTCQYLDGVDESPCCGDHERCLRKTTLSLLPTVVHAQTRRTPRRVL